MSPVGGQMTEKELRQSIVRAAREFGWRVYFTWSSMHSPAGFPDLCMVRGNRLLFAELKTDKGKITPDQQAWMDELSALAGTGHGQIGGPSVEVHLWRPSDLERAYTVLLGGGNA